MYGDTLAITALLNPTRVPQCATVGQLRLCQMEPSLHWASATLASKREAMFCHEVCYLIIKGMYVALTNLERVAESKWIQL